MKTNIVRRRLVQAVLVGAVTTVIVAIGTPAFAATVKTCTISTLWGTSCSTGAVPPNSGTHSVNWEVSTVYCGAHWQVIDAGNGVQVGVGNVGANVTTGWTISGLYSSAGYYLRVTNSCWPTYGKISNP
jgi:hypothetical protein